MKKVICLLLLFISIKAYSQNTINLTLKRQLDSVMALDQKYRETLTLLTMPDKKDSVLKSLKMTPAKASNYFWKLQERLDSLNILFIENVFKQYGYPGKSLVGSPTNESAWNVIQHSDKISQYIPLIKNAAEHKELPYQLYAMMLDRDLMDKGKEQIYGTQGTCRQLKNGVQECFIWPIQEPKKVNARRKNAGFEMTVEDNAKRLGIEYRVVKLKEVK
ncbi:DUF6624 domain-containing protein [Mucilaginibacter terrae]|uniref:DUF6624 domain-containing protein n=1 Tax=Mucilaginibacter terrae TaxID=1955052 RepID=UPI00363EF665